MENGGTHEWQEEANYRKMEQVTVKFVIYMKAIQYRLSIVS